MPNTDKFPSRIALQVEYDGTVYSGWQKQHSPLLPTLQGEVEKVLSQIADQPITVTCAGRTDAGVHATCQVVHFDCNIDRGTDAWVKGSNSLLPGTIRVLWARTVTEEFHARFSATARRYNYVICQRKIAPAILVQRITHIRASLDVAAMNVAAGYLVGENDFSSFRAAGCQSQSPHRHVMQANVCRRGAFIILDIKANAFLQHMVRNIVGALLEIGRAKQSPDWIQTLLTAKDRTQAATTAAPDGLYLVEVSYPRHFNLPVTYALPSFLDTAE